MRIFGKGFNYSQDGPGNRLVYHLCGCNMRCPWCSNPEGLDGTGGLFYTVEEIVEECANCQPLFFNGGGVTFTGGECTLQEKELLQVLRLLRAEGIHTAIETNGTSKELPEIAEYVDYLMMDFKHYDTEALRRYTGVGNEVLIKNFAYFCRSGRQLHIRIPLIKGFNIDDPAAFAMRFIKYDTSNVVFEFLPYHEYGKEKWKTEYQVTDGFVPLETVENFKNVFTMHGLTLIST